MNRNLIVSVLDENCLKAFLDNINQLQILYSTTLSITEDSLADALINMKYVDKLTIIKESVDMIKGSIEIKEKYKELTDIEFEVRSYFVNILATLYELIINIRDKNNNLIIYKNFEKLSKIINVIK